MKVLAFVDLHGWFDILDKIHEKVVKENVDIVLCAGDMSVFGRDLKLIMDRMSELDVPVLVIHGNHEEPSEVEKFCNQHENLHFIHQGAFKLDNFVFFGYGGGGFSKRDNTFARISKKVEEDLGEDDKLIVMLHGPPFGTKVDLVGDNHTGNEDYSDFIKRAQPELVICGHLHENERKQDKIGESKVVNPGPEGKIFQF
jgi:Icc-related predicted phosphoesterase